MRPRNAIDDEKYAARQIMKLIRRRERELRRRFGFLRYQNGIAAGILLFGLAGMIAAGALYIAGLAPWWLCIPASAFFASLLHELEHDQIHRLYFQKRARWMERVLFYLVWLARANTVNPYYRRALHFQHHRLSGTRRDVEERFITNGMPWSPLRLWALFDQRVSGIVQPEVHKMLPRTNLSLFARVWVFAVFYFAWDLFVLYVASEGGLLLFDWTLPPWWSQAGGVITAVVVVWVAPNLLRQFCLQFISSNMHYYGDFQGRLLHQTQVLNRWYLVPFQLFCFNFGSTHGIHHFVVNQPFYLRQMLAPAAHASMRRHGVRFNDMGTFRRANRYYERPMPARAA